MFTELEVNKTDQTSVAKPDTPVWVLVPHASLELLRDRQRRAQRNPAVQKPAPSTLQAPKAAPAYERIDSGCCWPSRAIPDDSARLLEEACANAGVRDRATDESHSELKALAKMRWRHAQGRIAARRKQFDAARDHLAAVEGLVAKGTLPDGQQSFVPQLAGYIAFYQGNHDEAIAALAKADQQDPFVLGLLAQAYSGRRTWRRPRNSTRECWRGQGSPLQMALSRPLAAQRLAGR